MSYDNNYNDNDYTSNQWQGSTWTDNGYQPGKAEDPISSYGDSPYEMNAKDLSKLNFEENVLSQSFVFMAIALLITALTAFYIYSSPKLLNNLCYDSHAFLFVVVCEFVVIVVASITIQKNLVIPSAILYTLYSVLTGATVAIIFARYTTTSIATSFFITAGMFGIMAIYGLTTKKDLSSWGSIGIMALCGTLLAAVINFAFLHNTMFDFVVSIIVIMVFIGLTAYDTQKIKQMARYAPTENVTCLALYGALDLYLDFINLFLRLVRILGRNRD